MDPQQLHNLTEALSSLGESLREMPVEFAMQTYFSPQDYHLEHEPKPGRIVTRITLERVGDWYRRQMTDGLPNQRIGPEAAMLLASLQRVDLTLEYSGVKPAYDLRLGDYSRVKLHTPNAPFRFEYTNPRGLLEKPGEGAGIHMFFSER